MYLATPPPGRAGSDRPGRAIERASGRPTRVIRSYVWMAPRRPLWALIALAVLRPGTSVAQTARDRDQLAAFRDSLAGLDGDSLRAWERTLLAKAKRDRANPGVHLRLGLVALKLGERSDAVSELKWTTQLAPQWGAAWLGLGLAELALGEDADTTRLGRRAFLAKDAWERSAVAIGRAVGFDPGLAAGAEAAVRDRLARGFNSSAEVIRDGLRRAVMARTRTADAALSLGRVEAELGDTAAALVAYESAAGLPGGRGLGLLEAARLRLTRGDAKGVAAFYDAAASDDSGVVAMLRADFHWIASAAELDLFDQRSGADRAQLLWHFFPRRDREELRGNGERLTEHYRRLAAGRRLFPNPDDQRLAVFVRHGEPDNRAALRQDGLRLNESWRYRRPEGDLLVHFQAGDDTTNYRVISSIFDVAGAGQPGAPAGDDRADDVDRAERILRSRAQLSPFYQAAVAGRRDQLAAFKVRERELGTAGRNLALTTDRFPIPFRRDLPVRAEVLWLGGPADRGGVVLTYAVPGFALDTAAFGKLRIRVAAWDSLDRAIRAIDTVVAAGPLERGQVRGSVRLPLEPGGVSVRAVLESGTAGALIGRDGLRIEVPGAAPRLTDLVVGLAGDSAEDAASADPRRVFFRTDSIRVAAAVAATEFPGGQARLWLRPVRGDGRQEKWRTLPGQESGVAVEPSGGGWHRIRMVVSVAKLKAGVYDIELEAADRLGRSIRVPSRMTVEEPPK